MRRRSTPARPTPRRSTRHPLDGPETDAVELDAVPVDGAELDAVPVDGAELDAGALDGGGGGLPTSCGRAPDTSPPHTRLSIFPMPAIDFGSSINTDRTFYVINDAVGSLGPIFIDVVGTNFSVGGFAQGSTLAPNASLMVVVHAGAIPGLHHGTVHIASPGQFLDVTLVQDAPPLAVPPTPALVLNVVGPVANGVTFVPVATRLRSPSVAAARCSSRPIVRSPCSTRDRRSAMKLCIVCGVSVVVAATGIRDAAASRVCFVDATGGSDTAGTGSTSLPYQTINYTLSITGTPCTEIRLKAGTYDEHVIVTRQGADESERLVITSDNAAIPATISPTTRNAAMPRQAAIAFYDAAFVTLRNVVITNNIDAYCTGISGAAAPVSSSYCNSAGIDIRNASSFNNVGSGASSHHIIITGNEIRDVRRASMRTTVDAVTHNPDFVCGAASSTCVRRYDALPVSVYSDRDGLNANGAPDASEATNHIQILNNSIHDCDGSSDVNSVNTIDVYQNVAHVLVAGNTIDDVISASSYPGAGGAIGVGGIDPVGSASDAYQRARNVVVRDNHVTDAGIGVFVQSATNILIERNLVERVAIGMQVVTEGTAGRTYSAGRADRIWIRDNRIFEAQGWGIDLGALSIDCATGYSPVQNVYVTNNTIKTSLLTTGVLATFGVIVRAGVDGDSQLLNNVIQSEFPSGSLYDSLLRTEEQEVICSGVPFTMPYTVTLDYNLWFAMSTARTNLFVAFSLPTYAPTYQTFGDYQVWGDANGKNIDPMLASNGQVTSSSSPAVNAGTNSRTPSWASTFGDYDTGIETDCLGQSRTMARGVNVIDMGACEWQ